MERNHPEYLTRLRKLSEAGRVELMGGGFYEPILISIPERDRQAQIARLRDFVKGHFGVSPRGAWLAERVWEPELPRSLAAAGVEYTLVDDNHFLSAGVDPEEVYGYYSTDSEGYLVDVIPGLQSLRYLIPWRPISEVLAMLSRVSQAHPNSLVTMGDDLEKFGSWPQTYHSVYEEHWLDDFFSAVESNRSWLRCTRACDYLDSHAPLGRVYLPTASYREMIEWWLPRPAAEAYAEALGRLQQLEGGQRYLRFLNPGSWRNFLAKYSEANLLHKQMLAVSKRFKELPSSTPAREKKAPYALLLAAQCNDAYWHGVFGGLYAPHLRHAAYSRLIEADAILDKLEKSFEQDAVHWKQFDLTRTGRLELEARSERINFLIRPSDGATVAAIHYKPACVNLVNSLRRRPEVYHKKLSQATPSQNRGELRSIHDRVEAKEEGLSRYLLYDRYDRNAFRSYFFSANKAWRDFQMLQLEESPEWAGAEYALAETGKAEWLFVRSGPLSVPGTNMHLQFEKQFRLNSEKDSERLSCQMQVKCLQGAGRFRLGLEIILNLLAGHAPDRYYSTSSWRENLEWAGELQYSVPLNLVDEWLKISLELTTNPPCQFWWLCPTFTVSQSEEGFEKVYQGSGIMPVWELNLKTADCWEAALELALRSLS